VADSVLLIPFRPISAFGRVTGGRRSVKILCSYSVQLAITPRCTMLYDILVINKRVISSHTHTGKFTLTKEENGTFAELAIICHTQHKQARLAQPMR